MRALIASLGAGISLVAGAALSLLVVSFVFAYDGLTATDQPVTQAALLVHGPTTTPPGAPADRVRAPTSLVVEAAPPRPASAPVQRPAVNEMRLQTTAPRNPRPSPAVSDVTPIAPPPAAGPERPPATGDGVRTLGDTLSATVQDTAKTAGVLTAPLGPPVAQAVHKVLDLLSSLLKNTTGALAGTPAR